MTGYLLISCAAKAKGLTIVTHNIKHFEHIEGLDIISLCALVTSSTSDRSSWRC